MQLCRNCEHWKKTSQWRGNCPLHPWEKDKYSEDATRFNCPDFIDKYAKYQVAAKEVK